MAELDLRLSSYELTEWQLYEKITGPLGRKRGDIQAATVAAAITNAMRAKGKHAQLSDFMIPYEKRSARTEQSPHEMIRTILSLNRKFGGTVVRKGGED